MVIKISLQLQALYESDCISRCIEYLHLEWNLNNQLNDLDRNWMVDITLMKLVAWYNAPRRFIMPFFSFTMDQFSDRKLLQIRSK